MGGFLLLFMHFCFLVFEPSWRVMLGFLCALQCSSQIFKVHPIQTGNIQAKMVNSLPVYRYFEFWRFPLICLLLFTFQSSTLIVPHGNVLYPKSVWDALLSRNIRLKLSLRGESLSSVYKSKAILSDPVFV